MEDNKFEHKWRKVLSDVSDQLEYSDEASEYGWGDLPTKRLPQEAQEDINRFKRPISTNNILVINHGFCSWLDFNGMYGEGDTLAEIEYLANIGRLLEEANPTKIQTVMYDYPEHYVLGSRQRLIRGDIASVILTEFDGGGSLDSNMAYQEIGEGKKIYLAGSYLACLASTAEQLWRNDNDIVVIADAVLDGTKPVDANLAQRIKTFAEEIDIDGLSFISANEFFRQYGK